MLEVTCPTCRKQAELTGISDWPQFPFCSPRCKLIDLGRWLGEEYRLPDSGPPDDPVPDRSATPTSLEETV
ncbi:MAG TPA: DNA gyrase inhibitor YacG [Gemmatales bacterium]|nr:DNA gyrase inhibitor YacG [Gemmatales bacterium]